MLRQGPGEMGQDEWHLEGAEQHWPFQPNGQEAPAGGAGAHNLRREQDNSVTPQRVADLAGGQPVTRNVVAQHTYICRTLGL